MKTLSGGQLAGGNTTIGERAEHDYYATDPKTTELFLQRFVTEEGHKLGVTLEPACGAGHMSEVIKNYTRTLDSYDLINRGYGEQADFLTHDFGQMYYTVMTNPPFSLAQEFIERGLEVSCKYVIMLAKIQLLEGVARKEMFANTPLKYIYVHTQRQATWKNGEPTDANGKKWATTMCLAWFVWDKEYVGEPMVRWI